MSTNRQLDLNAFAGLLLIIVPSMALGICIRSLLRIKLLHAMLISAAINIAVMAIAAWLSDQSGDRWNPQQPSLHFLFWQRMRGDFAPVFLLAIIVAVNLAIALLMKLYRAAVLGKATPAENAPGIAGVRAWLSPLNVSMVICVAIGAYLALDYDYIGVFIAGLCVLLAYPLVNTMMQQSPRTSAPGESASPQQVSAEERQRILALVEAGKITAEDGAELLTALAQSQAAGSTAPGTLSGPRRVMLVGAAITLVGFFLPWFTTNISQAMRDAMSNLQQNMPQLPGMSQPNFNFNPSPGTNGTGMPVPAQIVTQILVRGGDVQHGLGWIILAAGLCAACLPFFWTPPAGHNRQMRNAVLATLAVGSVLMLYVLSGSFNAFTTIEPGFILAIAGYVVLWVGSVREYVSLNPALHPAIAAV
jgi:hypothetical protein